MRYDTKPRVIAVKETSPELFEKTMNDRIDEIQDGKVLDIVTKIDGDVFFAVVTYEVTCEVVECVSDEYHNEGIRFTCRQCPYAIRNDDKRKKWLNCQYSPSGIAHLDHECCEMFYVELKQHKITPIE